MLDVGCGAGLALQMAQARGAKVSGLDAARLVEIAQSRCPGADIRVGDIEDLPFATGAFDVTIGFNAFQYANNPIRALREAKRVTKPNGIVVVSAWGATERCQVTPYLAEFQKLLPLSYRQSFALSAPGALEVFVNKTGLRPEGTNTVITIMRFPDDAAAVRGLLASAETEHAIRILGEDIVLRGLREAILVFRKADGTYEFGKLRFLGYIICGRSRYSSPLPVPPRAYCYFVASDEFTRKIVHVATICTKR